MFGWTPRSKRWEGSMLDRSRSVYIEVEKLECSLELAFRIRNRRNRLIGLWAASRLGLNPQDADQFAENLCGFGIHEASDDAIIAKIVDDLAAGGLTVKTTEVRQGLTRCAEVAALEFGIGAEITRRRAA
jgi:hypothetical protein